MKRISNNLSKTSEDKITKFLDSISEIIDDNFYTEFINTIKFDVKNIKDCSERSIVDFYIESCDDIIDDWSDNICKEFWKTLKHEARTKLVKKYVPDKSFDNNIDIYFNEVKKEYILHPMNESEDLEFIPENKEIFIKNNLKLVIDCAKRYQNLGLPLEDLIQTGNLGLMIAWDKFDTEKYLKKYMANKMKKKTTTKYIRQHFTIS